eukprot:EG_transcript_4664
MDFFMICAVAWSIIALLGTDGATIIPSYAAAFVKDHNIKRCMHGVPPLTWSASVAATAETWAATCSGVHTNITVRSNMWFGENLWGVSGLQPTAAGAVTLWYNEISHYDWSNPVLQPGTGHMTQVIWRSSVNLGCAMCDQGNGWKWVVCQYNPPGNAPGDNEILPPIKSEAECIAEILPTASNCVDSPVGWQDSYGYTCQMYADQNLCTADGAVGTGWNAAWGSFARYANLGKDASQACCACGGGLMASPSPSPNLNKPNPALQAQPAASPSPRPSASPLPSASPVPSRSPRPSSSPLASPSPSASSALASGYVKCADEGGSCSCSGLVQFGVGSTWTTPRAVSEQIACSNSVFGDPKPGQVKACYCQRASPSPSIRGVPQPVASPSPRPSASVSPKKSPAPSASRSPNPSTSMSPISSRSPGASSSPKPVSQSRSPSPSPSPVVYTKCADEGGVCSCTGLVQYGMGTFLTTPRAVSGQIACNNNEFGDPRPGKVKACYCLPGDAAPASSVSHTTALLAIDTPATGSPESTASVWPWLALPFSLLALAVAVGALVYCHCRRRAQQRAENFLDPEGVGRDPAPLPRLAPVTGCTSPRIAATDKEDEADADAPLPPSAGPSSPLAPPCSPSAPLPPDTV